MPAKNYLNWFDYGAALDRALLQAKEQFKRPKFVYGPPRGGLLAAIIVSHRLGIELVANLNDAMRKPAGTVLWVDDIVDTGVTRREKDLGEAACGYIALIAREKFQGKEVLAGVIYPDDSDEWWVFPYERDDAPTIKDGTSD